MKIKMKIQMKIQMKMTMKHISKVLLPPYGINFNKFFGKCVAMK